MSSDRMPFQISDEVAESWSNQVAMVIFVKRLADEVVEERRRQILKWPDCERLPDGTGGAGRPTYETIAKNSCDRAHREGRLTHAHVFEEECMEVLNATEPDKLRVELVQVMSVCAKWIADIDGRDR